MTLSALESKIFKQICENDFSSYLSKVLSSSSALYPGFETKGEFVRVQTPEPYVPPPRPEIIDSVSIPESGLLFVRSQEGSKMNSTLN